LTPEAAEALDRSRQDLDHARMILAIGLWSIAGRQAYLAAFHAAQTVVFEQSGKAPKTHRGLHSAFGQLAKAEPTLGMEVSRYLAELFQLKDIADYKISHLVTKEEAKSAIDHAETLVGRVERLLRQMPERNSVRELIRPTSFWPSLRRGR
jgi:uncharacterized protein (UPF0332 family)